MEIVSLLLYDGEDEELTLASYAVYIAVLVFYLIFAYFMYPETKNHTIEEVSMIFDKRDGDIQNLNDFAIHEIEKGTVETYEHC